MTQENCLVCRAEQGGNGRSAKHHSLNDLVWRAMAKADIPALLLRQACRTDGKQLLL